MLPKQSYRGGGGHKARRTLGEGGGGGGGVVEGSERSGLMHCYLACSSSSRHSGSVFKPEHRGCLAPGHCCQRLENSRVSRFSKPLLYSGALREKKKNCSTVLAQQASCSVWAVMLRHG